MFDLPQEISQRTPRIFRQEQVLADYHQLPPTERFHKHQVGLQDGWIGVTRLIRKCWSSLPGTPRSLDTELPELVRKPTSTIEMMAGGINFGSDDGPLGVWATQSLRE